MVLKETEQQIHILEQPCRADQQGALRRLRARTTVEIMADESCFSLHDAWQLACQEAVDGFNIKLMKCGGIFRALQIHTIAQTAGISCMIGCMMESPVGISAAAAVASACKNITYCDLDSFLCLKDNPNLQGGFTWAEPLICLEGGPGLGVRVNFDQLS